MDGTFCPGAVIFDMDGLMLDSEGPVIPLWAEAGKSFGWEIPPALVHRTLGLVDDAINELFIREFGQKFNYNEIRKEVMRLLFETFEKNGIACKPGLLPLLDHLEALKLPFGIATSTDRKTAFWKLEKAGLRERFTILVCGDEIERGKPAPDIFLKAAEKLNELPSACLGFEDSPAGLAGLHAAGIRSVFIKDLVEPPPEVLSSVWRRCENLARAIPFFSPREL
jgi:HAD superfamily hydrolase (TIGR01509 family)